MIRIKLMMRGICLVLLVTGSLLQLACVQAAASIPSAPSKLSSASSLPPAGRACGFYIWDVVSAGLHSWCTHLCRDCTYEGVGGRKFVRIEPGSVLQLLYPCSQYSPDRCLYCGGNFRDHMLLKWSKHMYTPFDLLVDRVLKRSIEIREEPITKDFAIRVKSYNFHKEYVLDVGHHLKSKSKQKQKEYLIKKDIKERYPSLDGDFEVRNAWPHEVSYVVPKVAPKLNPLKMRLLGPIRQIVLGQLTYLIGIQSTENEDIKRSAN